MGNAKDRPTWKNEKRKLRDLIPWKGNARESTNKQAARIIDSLDHFGQTLPIIIGPKNEILDGHQRKSAWGLAKHYGSDLVVDVRVCSRSLSEVERQKLSVYLNETAAGQWDMDALANWDAGLLKEWGFEDEFLEKLAEIGRAHV